MGGWWRCLFAGDPTVDLSVPRRSVTARGVQMRLLSGGSSASHIPLVRFVLLGRIFSLGFLVSSGSAKLAPVRSCGWFSAMGTCGEFLLSVLSPEFWRFLWQRVTRHGTASTSLWLSLSSGVGFLTVAAR
ncbi:hypothetical protein Bca101_052328 [Brassica carinata]